MLKVKKKKQAFKESEFKGHEKERRVLIYGSRLYSVCLSLFFMLNFASSMFMLLHSMRYMIRKKKLMSEVPVNFTFHLENV